LRQNAGDAILPALFSSEEIRDLQVWSNLAWIDPAFRREEPIRSLFAKERHFTEEDKQALLDWQLTLIGRVISTYRLLFEAGKIDISFTPYYHPILPLLCDTNSALEGLPRLTLPKTRFRHPEDAEWHIVEAKKLFEKLFGCDMKGMWPSEGSVSEDAAELMIKHGVLWTATDEEILYRSLEKSGMKGSRRSPHAVFEYGGKLKVFFRDRALSDRIGFVYSSWDADKAVADFIGHLKRVRSLLVDRLDTAVVPIILDGENAWEYFPNDGREFLQGLYRRLDEDPTLRTVTMTQAAESHTAYPLPALYAGSWINSNFRIWVGHPEDNAAWGLLSTARETLVAFEKDHPDYDPRKLEAAWRQVYIAEGSDWCWWYGDEHRG
ncbi:MAG: glycoside hydrolase family 57 protein, partial [Candidatus Zixiibacteriota bacterium]